MEKLKAGILNRLPANEKSEYDGMRRRIEECEKTLASCDRVLSEIPEHTVLPEELVSLKDRATSEHNTLSTKLEIRTTRLNFEFAHLASTRVVLTEGEADNRQTEGSDPNASLES